MTIPIPFSLLPESSTVAGDGSLWIGGCAVLDLAEEFGTPLFVYDEGHLRNRCREAVEAFGDGVAYATKAFLCVAMARLAHEEGMHLDVATGGEMHVALTAGVPPERLVLHGNNKSNEELRRAIELGIGRIVVDSFDEISRLEMLCSGVGYRGAPGAPIPVLLRITPGVEAHTHEFVRTGQEDSKFGFGVPSGMAQQAVDRVAASAAFDLRGLHVHVGSQIFATESFTKAAEVVAGFAADHDFGELSMGGGLGVAYVVGEEAPTISQWARAVRTACEGASIRSRILAEPGRSIAAAAAVTLYTVGTVKEIPGVRTYVSVDGGMSDNPRPVLYGSGYEAFLPRCVEAERPRVVDVVGKHCESGDFIVKGAAVPDDLHTGDILCTPVTGAYGHSMGSNYNKIRRPAVVFVSDGRVRPVVRRETYDDLLVAENLDA
ncbi:MAG TPA: diaminopimelate decarboxylase [Acidimicrobiales bacterium]